MGDRYACLQEAREQVAGGYADKQGAQYQQGVVVNGSMFMACMSARGYTRDPNGRFAPPPGGGVHMR